VRAAIDTLHHLSVADTELKDIIYHEGINTVEKMIWNLYLTPDIKNDISQLKQILSDGKSPQVGGENGSDSDDSSSDEIDYQKPPPVPELGEEYLYSMTNSFINDNKEIIENEDIENEEYSSTSSDSENLDGEEIKSNSEIDIEENHKIKSNNQPENEKDNHNKDGNKENPHGQELPKDTVPDVHVKDVPNKPIEDPKITIIENISNPQISDKGLLKLKPENPKPPRVNIKPTPHQPNKQDTNENSKAPLIMILSVLIFIYLCTYI